MPKNCQNQASDHLNDLTALMIDFQRPGCNKLALSEGHGKGWKADVAMIV